MTQDRNIPPFLFRNEDCYGAGVRRTEDVLRHEIFELGNRDAVDTILTLYGNGADKEALSAVPSEAQGAQYVGRLLGIVRRSTGKDPRFCLWLATEEAVRDLYDGTDGNIGRVSTAGAAVLSDLGYDGVLLGFETDPEIQLWRIRHN